MTDNVEVPEESDFDDEFNKLADLKDGTAEPEIENLDEPNPDDMVPDIQDNDGEPGEDPIPAEEPDLYAGLDDTAKEFFKKLEEDNAKLNHRIDSDDGRVRAYQKQAQELQSRLDKANEAPPEKAAPPVKSERWNKFAEEYPEVAEEQDAQNALTAEENRKMVEDALAPIKEQQQRIADREIEAAEEIEEKTLTEEFPEWKSAVETQDYSQWINEQPPGIQALGDSDTAQDAIALIGLFDSAQVANGKPSIRSTPDTGVETPEVQEQKETSKLQEKRQNQLRDGATVKSRGAKIDPGNEVEGDFDKSFEFYANKKDRQRA